MTKTPDFEKAAKEEAEKLYPVITTHNWHQKENAAYRNGFIAGCEYTYSIDKWISVKDRLPEDRMLHVLVFNGDAPEYNQHVFHAIWFLQKMNFKCVQNGYNYIGQITHWQPLPEPPKP